MMAEIDSLRSQLSATTTQTGNKDKDQFASSTHSGHGSNYGTSHGSHGSLSYNSATSLSYNSLRSLSAPSSPSSWHDSPKGSSKGSPKGSPESLYRIQRKSMRSQIGAYTLGSSSGSSDGLRKQLQLLSTNVEKLRPLLQGVGAKGGFVAIEQQEEIQ